MSQSQFRRLTGIVFIAVPVLLNIPYSILISTFDYPDILRLPAGDILTAFHQGGTSLIFTWWAFAIVGLPLLFAIVALQQILHREDTPYLPAATLFGVVSGLAQMIGLLRWTFVVPVLANAYADPSSNEATKESLSATFLAVHQYGGVIIGEHIGQTFTIIWMLLVSIAMLKSPLFRPWLGWFGIASGFVYLTAQLELFAIVIPDVPVFPLAGLLGSLLWLTWLVLIGVRLLRANK